MPTNDRRKRTQADTLAQSLAQGVDVEFDDADIAAMTDPIIFSYLENLGYEWTGESWAQIGKASTLDTRMLDGLK